MLTTADYVTPPLFPPEAIDALLRVGVVHGGDHVQVQLEMRSPTDGALIALESSPHRPFSALRPEVARMVAKLLDAVEAAVPPF